MFTFLDRLFKVRLSFKSSLLHITEAAYLQLGDITQFASTTSLQSIETITIVYLHIVHYIEVSHLS